MYARVNNKGELLVSRLVREVTSSSVSLVEILTTLLEDTLALPLDFLLVTVIHCWLSTMSGWTHIVSPGGVGIAMRPSPLQL